MKIELKATSTPDLFEGIPDAEFLAAFSERVASIAVQKLPDGHPLEPLPEYLNGARTAKISAFKDHPMLISCDLFKEPGGIEAGLLSGAASNIGHVMQRHGITGDVEKVWIDLTELGEDDWAYSVSVVAKLRNIKQIPI
jgi:hypothetical protein